MVTAHNTLVKYKDQVISHVVELNLSASLDHGLFYCNFTQVDNNGSRKFTLLVDKVETENSGLQISVIIPNENEIPNGVIV